jgi:hypothetical protein
MHHKVYNITNIVCKSSSAVVVWVVGVGATTSQHAVEFIRL